MRLEEAADRVAASDITAAADVPSFSRAAMDGYAVAAADLAAATRSTPIRLRVVDRIYSGQMPRTPIAPGLCAEIATGAPLPDGADAVVMVEETAKEDDDVVAILAPATRGQHISRRGADIPAGASVVSAGDPLTPGRIGAIAATGVVEVEVYARPRVAILSTGNEVVEPGRPLGPGQVYDVNRFTLAAVTRAHGGAPESHRAVRDSIDALTNALGAAGGADLLIFSGGSSVGERDLLVDLVSAHGEMIFHGISIKPGKPTAFALVDGTPLFGMPGNPTSCLSNAYLLLVPYLRQLARLPPFHPRTARVPLGQRIESPIDRHQIYTVRVTGEVAYPAFKGSGDITSLSQADGYLEIAEGTTAVEAGALVDVTFF